MDFFCDCKDDKEAKRLYNKLLNAFHKENMLKKCLDKQYKLYSEGKIKQPSDDSAKEEDPNLSLKKTISDQASYIRRMETELNTSRVRMVEMQKENRFWIENGRRHKEMGIFKLIIERIKGNV